ncbi:hypothetical protein GDO78_010927 [Eleutherodactylus coqui]|uniref:Uncharacterized protein n=1 Tax=Eleutherodactylus coqui TaxID=57060 RepID=A0A8J6F8D6_ELECQ|nr:hypothetical protein GDO78_010927 [Eleutherodactylus coqui]
MILWEPVVEPFTDQSAVMKRNCPNWAVYFQNCMNTSRFAWPAVDKYLTFSSQSVYRPTSCTRLASCTFCPELLGKLESLENTDQDGVD